MNGNRNMKMKLLDATLLGILASMASAAATAQDAVATDAAPTSTAIDCDDSGCRDGDATLFQLRTRSFDQPVTTGTSARSSSAAPSCRPDRTHKNPCWVTCWTAARWPVLRTTRPMATTNSRM